MQENIKVAVGCMVILAWLIFAVIVGVCVGYLLGVPVGICAGLAVVLLFMILWIGRVKQSIKE